MTNELAQKKLLHEEYSTEYTNFNATESLKSPKNVLELGKALVHELELHERGGILDRWLAHHLASLMDIADKATGDEKLQAESEAVDTIIKLWSHRKDLPAHVYPLGGYEKAIQILSRLEPASNPWEGLHYERGPNQFLYGMFNSMATTIVASILYTSQTVYSQKPKLVEGLDEDEKKLLGLLEQWKQYLPSIKHTVSFNYTDEGLTFTVPQELDAEQCSESKLSFTVEESPYVLLEHLKKMQEELGNLIHYLEKDNMS